MRYNNRDRDGQVTLAFWVCSNIQRCGTVIPTT